MSTTNTLKRRIQRIEERQPSEKPQITVLMWCPNDEDPPYKGGAIRVKALKLLALKPEGEKIEQES
jgi:hypothetical protein